jgi:protein O-mannosyl-transferase
MVALRFRLLLLCAAFVAFGGCLWAPFQFDDFSLLSDVPLNSPDGWADVFHAAQTRPLTFLSFWLNLRISDKPWTFHLFSLAVHLATVWLVALLLFEMLPMRAAQIGACLFAFHPLQTEAVVYVFARATLLAAFFSVLSLLFWRRKRYWLAALAFAAALLAKEEVAAFPAFLALLEWATSRNRKAIAPIAAMGVMSLAAGLRAMYATAVIAGSGAGAQAGITPFDYFTHQGVAILRYLWLLMVPIGLTVDADLEVSKWAASLAWGVIVVLVMLSWRGVKGLNSGFWLVGGILLLLPSSSVFPAADLAADRRMYLPMLCLGALPGLMLEKADRKLIYALGVLLIGLSISQTRVWENPRSLWMEAARHSPNKVRPKRQLARLVTPEQAVELLEEAKEITPDDPNVATDLGFALMRAGKSELALAEFGRAVALDPNSATAIHNRGLALWMLGQPEAARGDFERSLEKDPCLFDALWNLQKLGVRRTLPGNCRWTEAQRATLIGVQPAAAISER